MLKPTLGHQLQADADAEKGPPVATHGLFQRIDHAGDVREPLFAIGESADPGQDDPLGREDLAWLRGDLDALARAGFARGTLEGFGGGVEIAGAVIDDGDVHLF